MNDRTEKTIDQRGEEVYDPKTALSEQTLAVDLQRADIDMQIATAHKYPRSIDTVIKKLATTVLYNPEAAQNSIYSLPRGKKPILGPSIGFANALASAWGNCIDAARIVYVDRKEKKVNAEGLFHDLETNRRVVIPEDRRIVDSMGRLYSDDMIIITGKAAAAIARRNAILNVVPRPLWYPIYEQALGVVRGDVGTFAERKEKALKAFSQFGVKPEQVYMVLGLKGEPDLTFEHVPVLIGMYQALRDGSETVETMFDPRRMTGAAFETVDNPLGDEDEETDEAEVTGGATTTGTPAARPAEAPPVAQAQAAATQAAPEAKTAPAAAAKAALAPDPDDPRTQVASKEPAKEPAKAAEPAPATVAKAEGNAQAQANAADLDAMRNNLKNEDEYFAYWETFLAATKSKTGVQTQWSKDRGVRGNCSIVGDAFNQAKEMKERRERELDQQAG